MISILLSALPIVQVYQHVCEVLVQSTLDIVRVLLSLAPLLTLGRLWLWLSCILLLLILLLLLVMVLLWLVSTMVMFLARFHWLTALSWSWLLVSGHWLTLSVGLVICDRVVCLCPLLLILDLIAELVIFVALVSIGVFIRVVIFIILLIVLVLIIVILIFLIITLLLFIDHLVLLSGVDVL